MSNKQVLVYEVWESTNDLRSVFLGHIHLKKLMKLILKTFWNVSVLHNQAKAQEIRLLLIIFIDENHFNKEKYETT